MFELNCAGCFELGHGDATLHELELIIHLMLSEDIQTEVIFFFPIFEKVCLACFLLCVGFLFVFVIDRICGFRLTLVDTQ